MKQKLSVGWLVSIVILMLSGYAVLLYATGEYSPPTSLMWHMNYFASWVLVVASGYAMELERLHRREHLQGKGRFLFCGGLSSTFVFLIGLLSLMLVTSTLLSVEVRYGVLALALLYSMAMLMVCNRFTVVGLIERIRTGTVPVLNGTVLFSEEKFERWPFFPVNYEEISEHNDVGGTILLERESGDMVVRTGPLRLIRTIKVRKVFVRQLEIEEHSWLHNHLVKAWQGLSTDQIFEWTSPPLETDIQGVRVEWNGRLDVSISRRPHQKVPA